MNTCHIYTVLYSITHLQMHCDLQREGKGNYKKNSDALLHTSFGKENQL